MNAVQHAHTTTATMRVMWLAVALALFAALSYLLIQLNMLGVGDLQTAGGTRHCACSRRLLSGRRTADPRPTPLAVDRRCCDQCAGHLVFRHGVS